MSEFVSEPITPVGKAFDTAAMGRGEPGLPPAFSWRDDEYKVEYVLERWKTSSPEGGKPGNEMYLRRHYFKLHMNDETKWTVYFIRQTPKSGKPTSRWFLYQIDHDEKLSSGPSGSESG